MSDKTTDEINDASRRHIEEHVREILSRAELPISVVSHGEMAVLFDDRVERRISFSYYLRLRLDDETESAFLPAETGKDS
jgi:hypothetical protein